MMNECEAMAMNLDIGYSKSNKGQGKQDFKNRVDANEKEKLSDQLLYDILANDLLVDKCGSSYIVVGSKNHEEILEINSPNFKAWLTNKAICETGRSVNSSIIREVIENIHAKAVCGGLKVSLNMRIAGESDKIYYDLCNDAWQSVEIDKQGWRVIDNPRRVFKRNKHQISQVIPDAKGNINDIFKFLNLRKEDRLLFLVYLVSCFIPGIPHPIGIFHGEKGASKTTTLKILKKLIDPSVLETMTFPKNNEELIQVLSHNWYCAFDNISNLNNQTSDTLSRSVTGEGYSKRILYSNDDDFIYSYRNCVAINGINVMAKKDDLLDRSVLFHLQRISDDKRKDETTVWEEFESARPGILGGIFNILSKAIVPYITTRHNKLYRMADFTRWGYAIAQALDGSGNQFIKDYEAFIDRQNEEIIQANPFAAAIVIFIEKERNWTGKASELLKNLEKIGESEKLDLKSRDFPSSSNMVVKKLNQIKSNISSLGIEFEVNHTSEGNLVVLKKIS